MELLRPRHLVLVRHGESEDDVRRKKDIPALKHPKDEIQTELGHAQSCAAGAWITKNILQRYGLADFELYLTSPLIRAKQSARSSNYYCFESASSRASSLLPAILLVLRR